jgi:NADH-quinone oxidoreductase subunit J
VGLTKEILLFAVFATSSVLAALGVVVIRDPVKSAMSLIACFFSLACIFLLQAAELIAVLQILVYAGAIMVLFVFVIMLVENKDAPVVGSALTNKIVAPLKVAASLAVAYAIINLVTRSGPALSGSATLPEGFGSVASIGRAFFNDGFLFHFEVTSLLLLVGIVGAVVVSKGSTSRRDGRGKSS